MPLYEYKCSSCGAVFEVLQKVSEPPLKACIKCGGEVRKLISPPAIQFKGSGWYVTDYANRKGPVEEKGPKEKAAPKKQESESKKESTTPEKD